jgi:hypothetical protein
MVLKLQAGSLLQAADYKSKKSEDRQLESSISQETGMRQEKAFSLCALAVMVLASLDPLGPHSNQW